MSGADIAIQIGVSVSTQHRPLQVQAAAVTRHRECTPYGMGPAAPAAK